MGTAHGGHELDFAWAQDLYALVVESSDRSERSRCPLFNSPGSNQIARVEGCGLMWPAQGRSLWLGMRYPWDYGIAK